MRQDIFHKRKKLRQWNGNVRGIERRNTFDRVKFDAHLMQFRTGQCCGPFIFRDFLFYLGDVVRHNPQIRIYCFPANANRRCLAYPTNVLRGKSQIPGQRRSQPTLPWLSWRSYYAEAGTKSVNGLKSVGATMANWSE